MLDSLLLCYVWWLNQLQVSALNRVNQLIIKFEEQKEIMTWLSKIQLVGDLVTP